MHPRVVVWVGRWLILLKAIMRRTSGFEVGKEEILWHGEGALGVCWGFGDGVLSVFHYE